MDKRTYYYSLFTGWYSNILEHFAIPIVRVDRSKVTQELDIKYGDDKNQRYDLIYTDTKTKKPLFVYIHGGGFVSGILKIRRPYCIKCAEEGYFAVNLNYRFAPKTNFPEQFNDIFKVLELIFDNAEKYNIDTSRIVFAGESAGAYFSSYLGSIAKNPELFDKLNIKFKYKDSFDVKGTVLIHGVYDLDSMINITFPNIKTFVKAFFNLTNKELKNIANMDISLMNATTHLDKANPPCVVVRGKYDALDAGSRKLIEILSSKDAEHYVHTTKGLSGIHGFAQAPVTNEGRASIRFTLDKVNEFIDRK